MEGVAKAALPMAQEAISAALTTKGPMKRRLKAAAQSATTKDNLLKLGRTAVRPIL